MDRVTRRPCLGRGAYPGLVLLLLLVQLGLVHAGSVQVEPQRLRYPGEERGEQRGHVCHTEGTTTNNQQACVESDLELGAALLRQSFKARIFKTKLPSRTISHDTGRLVGQGIVNVKLA